jgi:hypothetical protein
LLAAIRAGRFIQNVAPPLGETPTRHTAYRWSRNDPLALDERTKYRSRDAYATLIRITRYFIGFLAVIYAPRPHLLGGWKQECR